MNSFEMKVLFLINNENYSFCPVVGLMGNEVSHNGVGIGIFRIFFFPVKCWFTWEGGGDVIFGWLHQHIFHTICAKIRLEKYRLIWLIT